MRWACGVILALLTACSSAGQGSTGAEGGAADGTSSGAMPVDGAVPSDGAALPSDASVDVGAPAIDPNTRFTSLTNAELGEICDWQEALLGGYGAVIACQIGNMNNYANQAECVGAISFIPGSCSLTVGQYEACVLAQVPSKGCSTPDPQCSEVFVCNRKGD
jgi:hypothetical protein